MSEYVFEEDLKCLLEGYDYDTLFVGMEGVDSVSTFQDAGVLTRNKGLVVEMLDGSEYQVTIVKSK